MHGSPLYMLVQHSSPLHRSFDQNAMACEKEGHVISTPVLRAFAVTMEGQIRRNWNDFQSSAPLARRSRLILIVWRRSRNSGRSEEGSVVPVHPALDHGMVVTIQVVTYMSDYKYYGARLQVISFF